MLGRRGGRPRQVLLYNMFPMSAHSAIKYYVMYVITVTFGMTSPTMYYYTKVMSELFLDTQFPDTKNTFRGMTTMQDFWRVSLVMRSSNATMFIFAGPEIIYMMDPLTGDVKVIYCLGLCVMGLGPLQNVMHFCD